MNNRDDPLFGDGLGVALVTPFLADGRLDLAALPRVLRHVVDGGASFVVALGSTGEAAMLTERERDEVIATTIAHAGHAAVLVGTGASSTAQASAWTRRAQQLGARGALVVVPPYTRPTQAGLLAHFRSVCDAAPELPIVAYNVPSRTGTNLLPSTVRSLWSLPSIVALKESSGDLQQIAHIAAELPPDRVLLAGDDALALPSIAVGARGLISVAGNVVPQSMRDLVTAACTGDFARARQLHHRLLPLFDALAVEPNPIPIKCAMALAGLCEPMLRLPLLPANESTRQRLLAVLPSTTETAAHA